MSMVFPKPIAPQLEVLDPPSAGEDIEGDVHDVVGFVVRKVSLGQMELAVDLFDKLGLSAT